MSEFNLVLSSTKSIHNSYTSNEGSTINIDHKMNSPQPSNNRYQNSKYESNKSLDEYQSNTNNKKYHGNISRGSKTYGTPKHLNKHSNQSFSGHNSGYHTPIKLVPTRHVLKLLAQECKPTPPWFVGINHNINSDTEIKSFSDFIQPTLQEQFTRDNLILIVTNIFKLTWPTTELGYMSTSALNIFPPLGSIHLYASETNDVSEENINLLRANAYRRGFQFHQYLDYRHCLCIMLTEVRSSDKIIVRIGDHVKNIESTTNIIKEIVLKSPSISYTLVVIDALLRQNMSLDESNKCTGLSSEAIIIMLLSIYNSYSSSRDITHRQLLLDFFITFGFQSHFNPTNTSVSINGIINSLYKKHINDQLSVLDPTDDTINLASTANKVSHILAVFNCCYTSLSQFEINSEGNLNKAQSYLSSIIGGETYWSRVLNLYEQRIEPFYSVVSSKYIYLIKNM